MILHYIRKYDIDLLFLISILATTFFSIYAIMINERPYFEVTFLLLATYFVSKIIEIKASERAEKSFCTLFEMLPRKVKVFRRNRETKINTKNLKVGDIIVLSSGEKIPADGKVISGNCCVNESMVTGESEEVEKNRGDEVIAGTIITNGSVKVRVKKIGEDTYINQIFNLVRDAQKSKTKTAVRIQKTYTAMVVGIILFSLFSFVFWRYIFSETIYISLRNSVSVLVVSSNASLLLATPLSILFGVTRASKNGIILKNGQIIEDLSEIDTYIFDKTGTLTVGKPEITRVKKMGDLTEDEMVKLAAIAEKNSNSKIAKVIVDEARRRKLRLKNPRRFREYHGSGVYAELGKKKIHVGNREMMKKNKINTPKTKIQNGIVFISVDKKIQGFLEINDQPRESSADLIGFLKSKNKEIILLTGDNKKITRKISKDLGIEKYYYGLNPKKKLEKMKHYQKQSKIVMVGDGINDAPSLSVADVGISFATGNDLTSEIADVVLVREDIGLIKNLFKLSEETRMKIRQNFFWTYLYNSVAVIVVGGGLFLTLGLWVDPFIASAAGISSTLSILINSLSLRRVFNGS